jgi:hypothetical protein
VIPASSENSPSILLRNTWGCAALTSAFAGLDVVKKEKYLPWVFIILTTT